MERVAQRGKERPRRQLTSVDGGTHGEIRTAEMLVEKTEVIAKRGVF
jgi:hypothetical protein